MLTVMKFPEQEHCAFCPTTTGTTTDVHGEHSAVQHGTASVIDPHTKNPLAATYKW
jgi:hypothetical protein